MQRQLTDEKPTVEEFGLSAADSNERPTGFFRRSLLALGLIVLPCVLDATDNNAFASGAQVNVVSLGDSFSSGNATGYYEGFLPCFRSPMSFPALVAKRMQSSIGYATSKSEGLDYTNGACSGAVSEWHVLPDGLKVSTDASIYFEGSGTASGTQQVNSFNEKLKTADVVTLTIGGNDVGFSELIKCAIKTPGTCADLEPVGLEQRFNAKFPDTKLRLLRTYLEIIKRTPQSSRLIVSGYPQIIETENPQGGCYLNDRERAGSDRLIDWINSQIKLAVLDANGLIPSQRIKYFNARDIFDGRQLCSAALDEDEYVNGLSWPLAETLHPNILGHSRWAVAMWPTAYGAMKEALDAKYGRSISSSANAPAYVASLVASLPPKDTDKDGKLDIYDRCPYEYWPNSVDGCKPALAPEAQGPSDPFGTIDYVRRTPGGVIIGGWAHDPNSTPGQTLEINGYGGDGSAVPGVNPSGYSITNKPRPDVEALVAGAGPNRGYEMFIPQAGGTKANLSAYFINVGAGKTRRGATYEYVAPASPFGSFDVLRRAPGGVEFRGWAIDPDVADPIDVDVVFGTGVPNGQNPQIRVSGQGARPDVASAFPGYDQFHGYNGTVSVPAGQQRVCAYGINKPGTPGSNQLLACREITVSNNPFGALDKLTRNPDGSVKIEGWAIDPDTNEAITVDIYGGDGIADPYRNPSWSISAGFKRDDVALAYPGFASEHGINAVVSAPPGMQTFCLYAINKYAGQGTKIGCAAA